MRSRIGGRAVMETFVAALRWVEKSVWVRNHTGAPEALEAERMRSGSPSRNPARHCRDTAGRPALAAEDLRVVWLPEGNGAALYERDEILAIIPPWSGTNEFHGYARDNIGEGPVAWELGPSNVLFERFNQAQSYWKKWDDKEFWPSIQSSQIAQLEGIFGSHTKLLRDRRRQMAAEGDGALCVERPHGPGHGRRSSAAPAQRGDGNRNPGTASPHRTGCGASWRLVRRSRSRHCPLHQRPMQSALEQLHVAWSGTYATL